MICRYNPNIIIFNVHSEHNMENGIHIFRVHKIAGELLILRILLDDLIPGH
ncbi:MAG: hypothetical protein ACE5EN_01845 [Nitrospinota bacterium]